MRLVPAVTPADPAACADTRPVPLPCVPPTGSGFVPFDAAETDGGDADLSPPALSLNKIVGWLLLAGGFYVAATGIGIGLGWCIEALMVWGFP